MLRIHVSRTSLVGYLKPCGVLITIQLFYGYLTSNFQAEVSWNATIAQRQEAHCEFVNTFIFLSNLIDDQCGFLWSAYGDVWCEVFNITHWLASYKVFRCNKLEMWLVASIPNPGNGSVCSILFFCSQTVIPL